MHSVLRKKIEAGTGLHPAVLQADALWGRAVDAVTEWSVAQGLPPARVTLMGFATLEDRAASALFGGALTYRCAGVSATGLMGLVFQETLVRLFADKRLGRHAASATEDNEDGPIGAETPTVFLRTLFAPAARLLQDALSTRFQEACSSALAPSASRPGKARPTVCQVTVAVKRLDAAEADTVDFLFDAATLADFARRHGHQPALSPPAASGAGPDRLEHAVSRSSIDLHVQLEQLTLTIGECSRLQVGRVIPLPGADLAQVEVAAETLAGRVRIAQAELGLWRDQRAVRLTTPIDETFGKTIRRSELAAIRRAQGDCR
jgi:hypothetical protein